MALKLLSTSGAEPVTLSQAKLACRVDADITADDTLLTSFIKAARSQAEQQLGRSLVTSQYERSLDAFPPGAIELARPHVTAINALQYVDTAGTLQTLSSTLYTLDDRELPGWCVPAAGATWPDTLATVNAVRVTFTCGWTEGTLPEDIQAWVLMRVATLYKFREAV